MRPADDIRRFIDKAAVSANPTADKIVLDAVLKAREKAPNSVSGAIRSRRRIIVMKNPMTRLAAAAVLVIVVISVMVLDRSAAPAYALADLRNAFDQAHALHIKGRKYFPTHKMPDGTEIPPVEIDTWIDVGNHRFRYTHTGLSTDSRGNVSVSTMEVVCDGTYTMTINSASKTAIYMQVSDLNRELMTHRLSQLTWSQLCVGPDLLGKSVKVGREQINAGVYDIWQVDTGATVGTAGGAPRVSTRFKLWLGSNSGRLGRSQMWRRDQDARWQLECDFQTIEYDVEPAADTFALEPPSGYIAANTKETAVPTGLTGSSASCGDNGHVWECGAIVGFTLADGSVITGWHSSDRSDSRSQQPLFAGLAFGGPLPKLPVEFFALKPAGTSSGATWKGYHLTWTRKANRFIEWSVYVPDGEPPSSVRSLGYDVLYRFNLDQRPGWTIGVNVEYGPLVQSDADFNKWVLGAMGELSDSGVPPTDVTYQKVVDLARRMRNP